MDIKILRKFRLEDTYELFKLKYKRSLGEFNLKRDDELDHVLVGIWEFATEAYRKGFEEATEAIKKKQTEEELVEDSEPVFVLPNEMDEYYEEPED